MKTKIFVLVLWPVLLMFDVLICATTHWPYHTLRRESEIFLKKMWNQS